MRGQVLVTLLFFTVIATAVSSAAILVITENLLSGSRFQEGVIAYQIAQSGADNALIRILRDPSYSGETLNIGSGSAAISVMGSGTSADPYIILSSGKKGQNVKKIEVKAIYIDNLLDVVALREVF